MKENDQLGSKVSKKLIELYNKFHEENGLGQYSKIGTSKRCILILLDRFDDLHTTLYHSWGYLSLIQDIFGIKNNNFQYVEDAKAPKEASTTYSIDFVND